jgi:hypothetical protein
MDLDLDYYAENKWDNEEFSLEKYVRVNPDLYFGGVGGREAARHWATQGRHECFRSYSGNRGSPLMTAWAGVFSYLRTKKETNETNETNEKTAFIVTTCLKTPAHLHYLTECLAHIRRLYPHRHIYVIEDNSAPEMLILLQQQQQLQRTNDPNLEIVPSRVKGGGEINPYLFLLEDERCTHDKLIYIHDTVFLKRNIDAFVQQAAEINFMWYCDSALYQDTFVAENRDILQQLYFYLGDTKMCIETFIRLIGPHERFTVKFGAMAVFTRAFMQKVNMVTNFRQVTHLFHKRVHRCFFERVLAYLVVFIYGHDVPMKDTLCGSILKHPRPNGNTAIHLPSSSSSFYMVKVWQGR